MHGPALPADPFALVPPRVPECTGRRAGAVFGLPVEIVALPARRHRQGAPQADRPALQRCRASAIIAAECVWEAPGLALTGNAWPITDRHVLLWATDRRREPSLPMLEVAFALEDRTGGTTFVNSMGAAGSITRAHIHLLGEAGGFLDALPSSPVAPMVVGLDDTELGACELVRLDPPFPGVAVGVRGAAADRARAVHHLLECRTTPAFNLVGTRGVAWLVPRGLETPAPDFPQALGGAEIWGRWCCNDATTFDRLDGPAMERALAATCVAWA